MGNDMRPEVYWIQMPSSSRLAIMPRPSAGDWLDDEIAGWLAERIDIVVSLLESDEISELRLGRKEELCKKCQMEFISFPISVRGYQSHWTRPRTLLE
jgi:hypothetical protein